MTRHDHHGGQVENGDTFAPTSPVVPSSSLPKMSKVLSENDKMRTHLRKTLKLIDCIDETMNDFIVEEKDTIDQLERVNQQLKELEFKLTNLKAHISAARASKEKMESVAENLRCSLSPLRHLPIEILMQIFTISIEQNNLERGELASEWRKIPPDRTALVLSQVCRRWQLIFGDNSFLWNFNEFSAKIGDEESSKEAEIRRFYHSAVSGISGQQSLFIHNWSPDQHSFICETIGAQPEPYKAIGIDIIDEGGEIGGEIGWNIRVLSAKNVTIYRNNALTDLEFFTPLLRMASTLTIYGAIPRWAGQPWIALRTLIIREFRGDAEEIIGLAPLRRDELMALLNAAPFLEALELGFRAEEANLLWSDDVNLTHTHLKSLTVHLHHFIGGRGLLGVHLDLPALQSISFLSIHCGINPTPDGNFICKFDTATILQLPKIQNHEAPLAAELLRWLPNVRRLELYGDELNGLVTFAHAAYHRLPPVLMPLPCSKLTTLHLENTDIHGETLLEFVRLKLQHKTAGTEGVSAMECVEMYNTPGVSVADWAKIQEMLGEGRALNGVGLGAT